jgi:CDP-diacylglycerol---serine O-phosphatidyltransferase
MMIKKHIPNFITSLNLLCGCLGISAAFNGNLEAASALIGLAALFDFLDGMSARLLYVHSDIGKELDSLADVISFGLLPGVIIYQFMRTSYNLPGNLKDLLNPFPYLAFIIPIFSALRLAKFNIDTRQTTSFIGLPTPAAAIVFGSFPLIHYQVASSNHMAFISNWICNYYVLAIITIVISGLLVSEIPLFSLKFKNLIWRDNKAQYLLLLISLFAILTLGFVALPLIIVIYLILSIVF